MGKKQKRKEAEERERMREYAKKLAGLVNSLDMPTRLQICIESLSRMMQKDLPEGVGFFLLLFDATKCDGQQQRGVAAHSIPPVEALTIVMQWVEHARERYEVPRA